LAFVLGAVIGGRLAPPIGGASRPISSALAVEAALLLTAAISAAAGGSDLSSVPGPLYAVIVLTGLAMGIRNAVVRKLAVPDLTTTVLTLTITGLAADSPLAGGDGPRWQRRVGSVASMFAGAAAGGWLVTRSVAHALAVAGLASAVCTLMADRRLRRADARSVRAAGDELPLVAPRDADGS